MIRPFFPIRQETEHIAAIGPDRAIVQTRPEIADGVGIPVAAFEYLIPTQAKRNLSSRSGIVELDRPAELMLSVALHPPLHPLVAHAPRRVVGDAELAVQRHRRCTFLVLGHEVDALEPHREGQLGGLEEGPGGDGGLAVAAIALLELVCGQLTASVVAAVRAHEAVGPSPLKEGVEALVFGGVEGEELVEADSFLELHWIARHVNFLFLSSSDMAVFYIKYCLDSRVIR